MKFSRARYVLGLAGPFSTKLRYEIYDISTIDNPGQYWNIIPPGNELAAALDIFHHIDELDFFRTYYTALNGIRYPNLVELVVLVPPRKSQI